MARIHPTSRSAVAALAFLALAAIAGCPGDAGDACRHDSDCASGLSCVGPNPVPSCGIPPVMQCSVASDCATGEECHAIPDDCSASGIGSMCGPPCGADDCSPGFRCNASGACEPVPCDEGFACAIYQTCTPPTTNASEAVYAETHGCTSMTCATDASCAGGLLCVEGVCQTGPGECEAPVAVP